MTDTNSEKSGTQTFLIECNRGNSVIDQNAPDSNNGKWSTQTDFSFERGDRVGVEAIMIESNGAGSQQQTIEFSGENIKQGETIQDWTDDIIVLEFGFYIKNNSEKNINLPLGFQHNLNTNYGTSLRTNQGSWIKVGDVIPPSPAQVPYKYQFPGCCPPAGLVPATLNYDNGGYNFDTGGYSTAFDVFELKDIDNVVLPFGLVPVGLRKIILGKTGDANPFNNVLVDNGELTIPLPVGYKTSGLNTPFASGLQVLIKDNLSGVIINIGDIPIEFVEPDYTLAAGVKTYTGRLAINLASDVLTVGVASILLNNQIIPVKPNLNNERPIKWGYSATPLLPTAPSVEPVYQRGARMGIGLYNGSAPNVDQALNVSDGFNTHVRINGGAGLWEQTRVWGAVSVNDVPQMGSSTTTSTPADGGRNCTTFDLRNYKDNRPYLLVSPEYQAPQPTPNGCGMCPKLQPMTAYVIIRADSSFEDVNNLAQKFTEAFHAINPLVLGQGKDLERYLDNQEFPYNNTNNSLPLTSRGFYTKTEALGTGGAGVISADYTTSTASLYNRVEPLWIGNLVKCLPANLTASPDWKNQAGNPFYYNPNDKKDYLKIGTDGDWNWNNLIYGNMALKDFNKCYSGDRFIRTTCWDGNTTIHPHRDIPRPVILNTQLVYKTVTQPSPPTQVAPFLFTGTQFDAYQPIFTNIEYTDDNLDIIEECMRHSEKYITRQREYTNIQASNDYEIQQNSPFWEYEMDLGMSNGSVPLRSNTDADGIMTRVELNWIQETPVSATAGGGTPHPSNVQGSYLTPAQSFPGNGSEIELQQARDVGRIQVFSRFQDGWLTGNGLLDSPQTLLENPLNHALGSPNAFCKISPLPPITTPIVDMSRSQDRNIGALPYIYNDEDGTQHTFIFFMSSKVYQPETADNFTEPTAGRTSWDLGAFGWGMFFGFSPQYGYDQPAIIPMNPDYQANQTSMTDPGSTTDLEPNSKWRWNNQNYVWCGANDALMDFDNTNNRYTLSKLYTAKLLSAVDATTTATIPANQTQLGEVYAGLNTDYAGTKDSYLPNGTNKPKHYKTENQGVEDGICGVYLNNVYFAPKEWKPPININSKNVYSPGSGSYIGTQPHLNPQAQTPPNFPYSTYSNTTTENREAFLAPLTKATPQNWQGNMLDKMGFDYQQIIPPYGGQDNRYSSFTYGRTDVATMYQGTKPLLLNAETDVAADLDLNVFSNKPAVPPTTTNQGTPLYSMGLLNNNPINLGNMRSASLIAQRIPTLFACPFYLVISDICPTQFQSGSVKQDCIFYGLKNYGAGQYFYVFGSNYTQLVDTNRTITQVNTEIRNPLTGRLARLSKNSCIIYKVERDITLPAIELDVNGQPIAHVAPVEQSQDDSAGIMKELQKLIDVNEGEKVELKNVVKTDQKNSDVLSGIRDLMKKLNINSKTAVGITDNVDFGGALRKPDENFRLTREEAQKIVVDEIALERSEGGQETKGEDNSREVERRTNELLEQGQKGERVDIDKRDLFKDLSKLLVEKALRALPITTGQRSSNIGNPVVITTAIKNSLRIFTPLLEELSEKVENGEMSVDDAIKSVSTKDMFLGANGNVVRSKAGRPKKGLIGGHYLGTPEFISQVADSWFGNEGGDIENLVREGFQDEDLSLIQGDEFENAPMNLDEIIKQRAEVKEKMKQYNRAKFVEGKAGKAGASEDMILEGRNLMEAEARKDAQEQMVGSEGSTKEERKAEYDKYYEKSKILQEASFSKNPLGYIRRFGNAGEGIPAGKILELQETHKEDEERAFAGRHVGTRRKEELSEGKE
tara:strand:- start:4156 stop:9546 length:5391 start_codon:yes stop_codon:yes gene_type:complete